MAAAVVASVTAAAVAVAAEAAASRAARLHGRRPLPTGAPPAGPPLPHSLQAAPDTTPPGTGRQRRRPPSARQSGRFPGARRCHGAPGRGWRSGSAAPKRASAAAAGGCGGRGRRGAEGGGGGWATVRGETEADPEWSAAVKVHVQSRGRLCCPRDFRFVRSCPVDRLWYESRAVKTHEGLSAAQVSTRVSAASETRFSCGALVTSTTRWNAGGGWRLGSGRVLHGTARGREASITSKRHPFVHNGWPNACGKARSHGWSTTQGPHPRETDRAVPRPRAHAHRGA